MLFSGVMTFLILRKYMRTNQLLHVRAAQQALLPCLRQSTPHSSSFIGSLVSFTYDCLLRAYGASGRADDTLLDDAISTARSALLLPSFPEGTRAVMLARQISALQELLERKGDMNALLETIALCRERFTVYPATDIRRRSLLRSLASVIWDTYGATGILVRSASAQDMIRILDVLIEIQREVVRLWPHDVFSHSGEAHNHSAASIDTFDLLRARPRHAIGSSLLDRTVDLAHNGSALISRVPGSVSRALALMELASALGRRFSRVEDLAFLDEADMMYEQALRDLPPAYDYFRGIFCLNFALCVKLRFVATNEPSALHKAIALASEADRLHSRDTKTLVARKELLAELLWSRYRREGRLGDLDEIAAMWRGLVRVCPPGHRDRARLCYNLGKALETAYNHTGDLGTLDEAIAARTETLHFRADGKLPSSYLLSRLLQARFLHKGDHADIDKAVQLMEETLNVPSNHVTLQPRARCGLVAALRTSPRFMSEEYLTLSDIAITSATEALAQTNGVLDMSERQDLSYALAVVLYHRFDRSGDLTYLDKAVERAREAMPVLNQSSQENEPHDNMFLLMQMLIARYVSTGDLYLFEEAEELGKQTLRLCPASSRQLMMAYGNVALLLMLRGESSSDLDFLREATHFGELALRLCDPGDPFRAIACQNQASALMILFQTYLPEDISRIDSAIVLIREELQLRSGNHPKRPNALCHLARALWLRFTHGNCDDVSLAHEAIILLHEVLDLGPEWYSERIIAAIFLAEIHLQEGSPWFDTSAAATMLRQATDSDLLTSRDVDTITMLNGVLVRFSRYWAQMSILTIRNVHEIYATVVSWLPFLANASLEMSNRLQKLSLIEGIGATVLACAIAADRVESGVELLEQSRAVFWSQALNLRDPQLDGLPTDIKHELEELSRALSAHKGAKQVHRQDLSTDYVTPDDIARRQAERVRTLIARVRAMPGLERFMLGPSYDMLTRASGGSIMVILSVDSQTGRALIISSTSSTPTHLLLPGVTAKTIKEMSLRFRSADANARAKTGFAHGEALDEAASEDDLHQQRGLFGVSGRVSPAERVLAKLWKEVVSPIAKSLGLQVSGYHKVKFSTTD
jgi:tetratricopeptide (TPR) repeat protein